MAEGQQIEWKQSWRDEYLKWICGFANALGGTLYIGKDDNGKALGVANAKQLLETIPGKVRHALGIIVDVDLLMEDGKEIVEIIIQPSSVPVSYRGRYYSRSGSTKTELTGTALNEFLLKKAGKSWDDVIEERATLADLDEASIEQFRKDAEKSGRLPSIESLTDQELLEKLRVIEGEHVKRAAIILFGRDPNRFYPSISVKLGRFGENDADLRFQEVEEGNIMQLLQRVPQQLNGKFLTKAVNFEGLLRIEKGYYPVTAMREMLLNALVHRAYGGSPIQWRIYSNKMSLWNEGLLMDGMEIEALKRHHISRLRHPVIASICFKAGYIDAWGRGTLKIVDSCREADLPEPDIIEQDGGILVTLYRDKYTEEYLSQLGLNERQQAAVRYLKEKETLSNSEYQELGSVSKATATRELRGLVDKGILTAPSKSGRGAKYSLR